MKIEVIFFCLLLSLASCKGQDTQEQKEQVTQELQVIRDKQELGLYDKEYLEEHVDNNLNIYTMEKDSGIVIIKKFDIERFNKNKEKERYEFVTDGGVKIEQRESYDYSSGKVKAYIECRRHVGSPYEYRNAYDTDGNIIESATYFYGLLIGIVKEYDKSGNIIKKKDFDTPYLFSIDSLIKKMKEEYNIDLLTDISSNDINRYLDKEYLFTPVYEVYNAIHSAAGRYRKAYLIDGRTGKTLFITDLAPIETGDEKSIIELYLESKEKEPLQKPVETKPSKPRKKI